MITENFISLFEQSIKANWRLPAMTDYDEKRTMTYGDVGKEIARLHLLFERIGLKRGSKVSLTGKNGCHWCIVYIATVTYGCVIVPILQDFNTNDIQHIVNHSESTLLFISDHLWEAVDEDKMSALHAAFSLNDLRCIYRKGDEPIQSLSEMTFADFDKRYPKGFSAANVHFTSVPNSEVVSINYTSGTTGFSKGVMLTGNNLAGNVIFGFKTHLLERGDRALAFLPLAHAYGCAFDFLTSFCNGAHTTYLGKIPAPKVLLKAFAEIRPSAIFTVPLIIEKVYRNQIQPMLNSRTMRVALNIPIIENTVLGTIRRKLTDAFGGAFKEVIIGGAPLNPEVEAFFTRIGFKFTVGYGMTECAPLICYTPHYQFISFSVGKILPGMEVTIDSKDPQTIDGEILVRGEHVMAGYYKNEEATRAVLSEDGWMRTGDVGTVDANGNLFIRGRCKSMLLSASGQNIYPEEIEAKLNNMPFVQESLIIENSHKKLVAFVYPDYAAVDEAQISHAELSIIMENNRKTLNEMVASYEQVIGVQLYPNEFAKTPKKSIKRYLYSNLLK
ncbi:MAG: AMP-binding protein [Prevotellaceae bacterium]|jgi:long-chain acyl-CoA synthetase|nr:AMP-binding protein [Prevotellaceae bacterium]